MNDSKMRLVDWLDDLCVRFIINLPHEELQSVERICFQIEEAQWFYEDFIRPLDPHMPSMNLKRFAMLMFQHCPLSSSFSETHHVQAYENFLAYKTRVPVRGAIMLNHDMTQAVLVKGWKKGAKWSFPRGKINKDEADLDCAVREVYEETGFDLRAAGLVKDEKDMKKIEVSMREQNMMLYVFRDVPMDTHFEPRTRKEISKIDWYRLTDLPTIKRKQQTQQGTGADLIKENNFYMVAPFIGQLKGWIKHQQKVDRQRAKVENHLAPPLAATGTDMEETEADNDGLGETTADETNAPDKPQDDENFANLISMLGRNHHRASDALPEVSAESQPPQAFDPAAELKRLLSVGGGFPPQPPVEAPAPANHPQQPPHNPLLAMLHGNNQPPGPHPPRTPFDQVMAPPQQPQSPHGQHHPRPPQFSHMPPPPPFAYQLPPNMPPRGPPYPHTPLQQFNGMQLPPPPRHYNPPPPHHQEPIFSNRDLNGQQDYGQQAPRPYHRTGDPQFASAPIAPDVQGPVIPPASNLPPPRLNAHTLGLLNAFKGNDKPTPPPPQKFQQPQIPPAQALQNAQTTPRMPPALHRDFSSFISPPAAASANPYAPSPPPFQSPRSNMVVQPVQQPKPRSAHQDVLLGLFRSPSVAAGTPPPPPIGDEPAELSAMPTTPGHARLEQALREAGPPHPDLGSKPVLLDAFAQPAKKAGITSATVSGPVNVPDFQTMKKNTQMFDNNGHHAHSRGPSPANRKGVEQKVFVPQELAEREDTPKMTELVNNTGGFAKNIGPSTLDVTTPQATNFKPQILRRPQQNAPSAPTAGFIPTTQAQTQATPSVLPIASVRVPAVAPVQAFDRRDTLPADQKNALLSLFGKPTQPRSPAPTGKSPLPSQGLAQPPLSLPLHSNKSGSARSPQPPTPKSGMSGIISPVSPLPDRGSVHGSPANHNSRSRISSMGEQGPIHGPPSIVIPQNVLGGQIAGTPTAMSAVGGPKNGLASGRGSGSLDDGYASTGSTGLGSSMDSLKPGPSNQRARDGKSPVDKTFLLGFLADVAKRGR
ncbi:hypothetical protein P154DRAFT_519441 [Amniculicola lignicola CBS 123094]|uniref:Nudix hydrolase domain-containing protein n=1 Tax=Amniculicola lignicola CBS 123094 TaxID=1392246 RepID=A0A6A5WQT1_9PLEO|nr:hypothetical protein P154DRAFT_519441 [Amniculicola lignicola CBS 123094]